MVSAVAELYRAARYREPGLDERSHDHQRHEARQAERVAQSPQGGEYEAVRAGGEGRGDRTLEGGK